MHIRGKNRAFHVVLWLVETLLMGNRVYSWLWFFTLLLSLIESNRLNDNAPRKNNIPNFLDGWISICFFQTIISSISTFFYSEHTAYIHRRSETVHWNVFVVAVSLFLYLHAKFSNIRSTHDSFRSRHFKNISYVRTCAIWLMSMPAFVFFFYICFWLTSSCVGKDL